MVINKSTKISTFHSNQNLLIKIEIVAIDISFQLIDWLIFQIIEHLMRNVILKFTFHSEMKVLKVNYIKQHTDDKICEYVNACFQPIWTFATFRISVLRDFFHYIWMKIVAIVIIISLEAMHCNRGKAGKHLIHFCV